MIPLFKVRMAESAAAEVARVLASGQVAQGPEVEAFERELEEAIGAPVLTTSSCTAALDLAMHLCGVGPGTEVIATPMTCLATVTPAAQRGAAIVWADVDPVTGLIDPVSVGNLVTRKTKAVLAVDWGGFPCDFWKLHDNVDYSAPIVEDAAHAFKAMYRGGNIDAYFSNSAAEFCAYSFQAIKHVTCGDGGALRVPEEQYARAKRLRWFGYDRKAKASFQQNVAELGYKYHMNDIAAAIGRVNLRLAEDTVQRHRSNAAFYHEALQGLRGVELPPARDDSSWWLYTLRVADRASFQRHMTERGIDVSEVHSRLDQHDALRRSRSGPLLGLEQYAAHQVSIPVHWAIDKMHRERIALAIVSWSRTL